ncbi:dihydrodipicolinate synthase family protein [Rhodococcus sp. IEGM 1366]|uniref:dihydrodipicolinate synthase family protein n=1 Tax=Rhodococcus sp. IEGM 1366 TaxID=3082223 RepID=UPI002953D103|nr:dihydrodipicolinate synthase family protein [Rhodococcus sp. IEGM 1366]MDV8071250.1 dihydrodipicolinate synthase family protein [Rhodococcus sp. IEGM 1366]
MQILSPGTYIAPVTVFDEHEELDLVSQRSYTEYLLNDEKIDGLLACGYTGEIGSLTEAEQLSIVRTLADATAGRVPLICGLRPTSTKHTIDFGRALHEHGADALLINAPFNMLTRSGFAGDPQLAVEFYRAVADGTGTPLVVFQYPAGTGQQYPPELLARICELPGVVGVKNAGSASSYAADSSAVGNRAVMIADSNAYDVVGMAAAGAEVLLVGIANIAPSLWRRFHEFTTVGDFTSAIELANRQLRPIIDTFGPQHQTTGSFVARIKEGLYQQGLIPASVVRAPEPSATIGDRVAVADLLRRLGLIAAPADASN